MFDRFFHEFECNSVSEKHRVFRYRARSSIKPERPEELSRCVTGDGMNTPTSPDLGNTFKFSYELTADAMSLGLGSDRQMPKLDIGISGTYGHQSSDDPLIFLRYQFELLAFQLERAAYISRKTQWLPKNAPKEFVKFGYVLR